MAEPLAAAGAAPADVGAEDEGRKLFHGMLIGGKLGKGAYGTVYEAFEPKTGRSFALKAIRIRREEGIPPTVLREISLLQECRCQYIIKLNGIFNDRSGVYLQLELLDMDLRAYLTARSKIHDPARLSSGAFQCVSAIQHCHSRRILHRDLKPQNVLLDVNDWRFVLADFGLARNFTVPLGRYTHEVVTLCYRAPEILMGQEKYATNVDVWSLACVISEMATAQPLFDGHSEIDMLFKIFKLLGTPNNQVWPGVTSLTYFAAEFPQWQDSGLASVRTDGVGLGKHGVDMLRECLRYNPIDRPRATGLLNHPFLVGTYVQAA